MRALVFMALILTSCNRGSQTAITREVYDAGGGDPDLVSPQALRRWFLEHRRFAAHIARECRAVKEHPLGWADTTEAKVCAAAMETEIQEAGRDHASI